MIWQLGGHHWFDRARFIVRHATRQPLESSAERGPENSVTYVLAAGGNLLPAHLDKKFDSSPIVLSAVNK